MAKRDLPQASEWPLTLRDLLRSPQHLKVFLNVLRGGTEPELFTSYQMMMERLWTLRVTNADGLAGRSEFLDMLATQMANDEVLWVPLVRYEQQATLITQLEAGGILKHSPDLRNIGFSHQTLFNHARARAFVRDQQGQSLADYVLARQNALFVRPTLWSSLTFLRGADPQAFQREFERLWSEPTLRMHVRLLLIEFLGQLDDPDDQEASWLLPCIEDNSQRGRALRAMAGRNGWFERLSQAYLPMIMGRDNQQDLNDVTGLLSEAWRTSYESVLALIQSYWTGDPSKDVFTWSALESLRQWDSRTVDLVCTLLKRGQVHPARLMEVVSAISVSAPTLAPQAVAVALEAKLDQLLAELPPTPEPPDNATEDERALWEWGHSPVQTFRKLFEDGTGWNSLIEVAEAAPSAFLHAIWPWFLEVLRRSASPPNTVMHNYRHDAGFGVVGESPVLDSMEAAVSKLAEHKPDEFLSFAGQQAGEDLFSVQQLLMKGMGKLFSTHPQTALDFFLADERRFEVGSAFDTDGETTAFISGLTPRLSERQRRQLEAAIQVWEPHRKEAVSQKPAEDRRRFAKWAREARLRLLVAMSFEQLSAEGRDFVLHEQRALPWALDRDVTMRGGTVASPMSVEQMSDARDEHILSLFAELTDETGWDHPRRRDFLVGGSVQASAALGELAKKSPDKVIRIINDLSPGTQEAPVAHAIQGLAESSLPPVDLVALIIALDSRGFASEVFRIYSAWALDKLIEKEYRLPDTICSLLENWREEMQNAGQFGDTTAQPIPEISSTNSILWGRGGRETLPQGTFTILETLARAYLSRKPMETNTWLALLERHLNGPENERTWKLLGRFLRYLGHADRTRTDDFLYALFSRYPGVRDSASGAMLLAQSREWMDPAFVRVSVQAIRDSEWGGGRQAYAELLLLLAVLPEHRWATEDIDQILAAADDESMGTGCMRVGLAHAAVNLWDNQRYRELSTRVLTQLFERHNADIGSVVMSLFGTVKFLPPDEFTAAILHGLLVHPDILEMGEVTYFVERLSDILPRSSLINGRWCKLAAWPTLKNSPTNNG